MIELKKNREDDVLDNGEPAFKVSILDNSQLAMQLSKSLLGVVRCSRQQIKGTKVSLSIDSVIVEEPLQIRLFTAMN